MVQPKSDYGSQLVWGVCHSGHRKMLLSGFKRLLAMLCATVLVSTIIAMPVAKALLIAGIGFVIFQLNILKKVPALLGPSFALLRRTKQSKFNRKS
ncbi:MAG: solute carrier family 23 protein [Prevotellaceae bacterium]|nr:solute carrier family 23 protein [Prevotellaceae bacterium]